MKEIDK